MNVLIIAATTDEKSGWGRHALAIAGALKKEGVEAEIIAEDIHDGFAPFRGRLPFFAILKNVFRVRRKAGTFDIIHAMDGWPYGVYGYLAVLGRHTPLFINGVGTYSVAPLFAWLQGFFLSRAYHRAGKIFCISNYTKKQLERAGVQKEKMTTIYFGVSLLPRPSANESAELRKKFLISSEAFPILLTVGAIKERKGQLETLRAVALVKNTHPHVLYIAAGSHNDAHYVAELRSVAASLGVENSLRIIEGADDREIAFLYSIATVFCLNSNTDPKTHHFEGFGAAVLEAAQFGKPTVGSSESGIEDAIQDKVSGLLSRQKDPKDIAEKVQTILSRYDFFSKNAEKYSQEFSWQKTASKYIQYYRGKRRAK